MAQGVPGALQPFRGQRQLQPGMRVRIGAHLVTVQRFLSQGGFACVYLVQAEAPVRLPGRPAPGDTQLVLKHMCVWDKGTLATVRAEVDHHVRVQHSRSAPSRATRPSCTLSKRRQPHSLAAGGRYLS